MIDSDFRLVLRTNERTEQITAAVEAACREINDKLDTSFRRAPDEQFDVGVTSQVWEDNEFGRVDLCEDATIPILYVSTLLRVGYGHQTIYNALKRLLPTFSVDELRDFAERGVPSRPTALARLGLGETDRGNDRTFHIICAGLQSADIEERRSAALAVFLQRWSEYRSALDAAMAVEPDASLLEQFKIVRDNLEVTDEASR